VPFRQLACDLANATSHDLTPNDPHPYSIRTRSDESGDRHSACMTMSYSFPPNEFENEQQERKARLMAVRRLRRLLSRVLRTVEQAQAQEPMRRDRRSK